MPRDDIRDDARTQKRTRGPSAYHEGYRPALPANWIAGDPGTTGDALDALAAAQAAGEVRITLFAEDAPVAIV